MEILFFSSICNKNQGLHCERNELTHAGSYDGAGEKVSTLGYLMLRQVLGEGVRVGVFL